MKFNIGGIILFVQDVDKLKEFYQQVFKLTVIEDIPGEWVVLEAGRITIALHKTGHDFTGNSNGNIRFHSNNKIVFETDDDITLVRENFIQQHVTMRELKTFPGYDYWFCDGEDPEGNVFQLKQKKSDKNK